MSQIIFERCAGLDVHKKTVVACRRRLTDRMEVEFETQTFGTTTEELLTLSDWLAEWDVHHVAMESTGEYWKPVFNILESNFETWLVNAQHVKHVPARKTDIKDAEWLAQLMQMGFLKPSFIPERPQRELRDLTRMRQTLVQERARVVNRVQKVLEDANIKLASVVTDILGVSARRMLDAMIRGEADPKALANLAKGRLRNKLPELEKALIGRMTDHHRFLLRRHLSHIDFLDEEIQTLSQEIAQRIEAMSDASDAKPPAEQGDGQDAQHNHGDQGGLLTWNQAIELLSTIPGIDRRIAEMVLAEIGLDMSRFPSARHLAAWAGLAPGNHQSGGKRYSGRTKKGNRTVRSILTQAAWAAQRKKDSYLAALYRRLVRRRGKKRAIVAVAHSMLVSIYYMLTRQQPYQDLGPDYFDQRRKEAKVDYLMRQLRRLGYQVALQLVAQAP
ncbi:MAG: IS110 family transposase [Chloroflexi bacterium]|nr:IS110 family transposase [Chloroflexota bacterium]